MTGSRQDSWSALDPRGRLAALLDPRSFAADLPAGASPYLARWNMEARVDDGIVTGEGELHGAPLLVCAQDARFVGGSIGALQARAMERLFAAALERRLPVVLLLESGGVRLYEANAAELALGRALAQLLTLRTAGIATVAVVTGPCFGGASVLACACASVLMLPHALLGLSGPKVIETALGKQALDAGDAALIGEIFGAQARQKSGIAIEIADRVDALRGAVETALHDEQGSVLDEARLRLDHQRLTEAAGVSAEEPMPCGEAQLFADLMPPGALPLSTGDWLWNVPGMRVDVLMPSGGCAVGPERALAMTGAVMHFLERHRGRPATLFLLEDSKGHELSRRAEELGLSRLLAHHAASLAVARQANHRIIAVLAGVGHSAAFFSNALQAQVLYALGDARVVAMDPAAIARVTRLSEAQLETLLEGDELLGQPVRHLQALGGVAGIVQSSQHALLSLLNEERVP